ncbi:hypothetical protein JYT86_00595 [bacterium AH-315-N03]|nr:hypothetical protein [bacterium AH-315-N03]
MKMDMTLEVSDLPAPVAWLDARDDVVVSILQAPREHFRGGGRWSSRIAPGVVGAHDPRTLELRVLARPEGEIRKLRLNEEGSRMVAASWPRSPSQSPARVLVWDLEGRELARRDFERTHGWDCAWWKGKLAIGVRDRAWSTQHGPKVELWTADLERCFQRLDANDAGFDVVAAGGLIATCGTDMHLWWPSGERAIFSMHESWAHPPGEMGSAVLSGDGCLAAVVHDLWRDDEPQALIVRVDALEQEPVLIADGTSRHVDQLAFSPAGTMIALRLTERPEVRVHRSSDGIVMAELEVPNHRAIAWLDDSTLLVGGDTLTGWSLR